MTGVPIRWEAMAKDAGVRAISGCPLSGLISLGVGGPCPILFQPASETALERIVARLEEAGADWRILGGGTNLLVDDAGVEEAVIDARGLSSTIRGEGTTLRVSGGVLLSKALASAAEAGLSGLEFAAGIPGTVGGAIRGNAGAWGEAVGERILSARVVENGGKPMERTAESLHFDYRSSSLGDRSIVLEAVFRLARSDRAAIRDGMRGNLRRRAHFRPLLKRSAGCFFMNPKSQSAGELIDRCGLKGRRIGGAEISRVHANIFVNTGSARSADFAALVREAREKVEAQFGVRLALEIGVWGRLKQQLA